MTQDERWLARYNEVKSIIESNRRNPSKYDAEERWLYCNRLRHNRKNSITRECFEWRDKSSICRKTFETTVI